MRAEFQAFRNFENQTTPCEFVGDIVSSPIATESIDAETASAINYYKIEGRQARFNIPVNDEIYSILLNRANYKNSLSSELTRIAVKIYTDDDIPIFFGILAYGFTYDGYEQTITNAVVYDVIYIINKYWSKIYNSRYITSDDYILNEVIDIALGIDESSPKKLDRYIPFSVSYNYLLDLIYGGFVTDGFITINSNWDVFYNDGQSLYEGEEQIGVFGGYDDVDISEGTDYILHRRISYGFTNLQDRLDITFMFYEYRSQRNPNQDGTVDTFDREKINIKTYIFTPGAQYQIKRDVKLTRVPQDTYETLESSATRLLDTEFLALGYELTKVAYSEFLNDFYAISVVGGENQELAGWNILFNGTVAQDIIRFNQDLNTDEFGDPIIIPANVLAGAMLINNLTIQQDPRANDFSITVENKLRTVSASSSLTLEKSDARTKYTPMLISEYDPSLLEQFIFGVSVEDIVNTYFTNLFNKYCVSKEMIFEQVPSLKIGDTITHDNKDYVIMELDRNYNNGSYKTICYGEE